MTSAFYHSGPAPVKGVQGQSVKTYPNGQPLTERAGASCILGENAYAFEFIAQDGVHIHACYDAKTGEKKYALEVCPTSGPVANIVTHCNCPDRMYRRRVCKHMIEQAVVLQGGLRLPGGSVVIAASALPELLSRPQTVADALRAMREDYHAAAARAVILTAAAVEEVERPPSVVCGFDPSDIFSDWK